MFNLLTMLVRVISFHYNPGVFCYNSYKRLSRNNINELFGAGKGCAVIGPVASVSLLSELKAGLQCKNCGI